MQIDVQNDQKRKNKNKKKTKKTKIEMHTIESFSGIFM